MVFKIMKAGSAFFAVDYNEQKQQKGQAENVYHQNFGFLQDRDIISHEEFKKYLENYSDRNSRISNPQFHAALSTKGDEHSFEELKGYALELMKRLGYENNPMLIYEHRDTKNNHIHIVTSRVGPNGKKIDHNLEGIRANKILQEIMKVDIKESYKHALTNTMSYNISTIAQFKLLMEKQGYKIGQKDDSLLFYKHGGEQGKISLNQIEGKIANRTKDVSRATQIKAFILKYKRNYSPVIEQTNKPNNQPPTKTTYESDLTNHLKKTFGIHFEFHGEKNKEPYGYTIIDNKQKNVFKGSEIMKLDELRKPLTQQYSNEQGKQNAITSKAGADKNTNEFKEGVRNSQAEDFKQPDTKIIDVNYSIDHAISDTMREVDAEANSQGGKKKRKQHQQKL